MISENIYNELKIMTKLCFVRSVLSENGMAIRQTSAGKLIIHYISLYVISVSNLCFV
jgi:hypothetical protein